MKAINRYKGCLSLTSVRLSFCCANTNTSMAYSDLDSIIIILDSDYKMRWNECQ